MKKIIFLLLTVLVLNGVSFGAPTQQLAGFAWDAPTTNADGSPYTAKGGFYVYYATTSGDFANTRRFQIVDPADTNVLFSEITGMNDSANIFFAVTAYDASGNESDYSNEVQNVPLVIPVAPANLRFE